ncbi:hypothetical protein TNCV_2436521 [Trichonephila clavipes]|nr:hypothetical protein TNCV_2436521 [Trichonephila clavipes]
MDFYSNFVFRRTRVAVPLYAALSKEAEVMVAVLTVYASADIVAPTSGCWVCCKQAHFLPCLLTPENRTHPKGLEPHLTPPRRKRVAFSLGYDLDCNYVAVSKMSN